MITTKTCVFCEKSKIRNIFAIDDHFYFVATPGQITDGGYIIIIPKRHVPCLAALEENEILLLEKAIEQCTNALLEEYGELVTIFEHGIVGQTILHAHLHLVPVKYDFTAHFVQDFPHSGVTNFANWSDLRVAYSHNKTPYLLSRHNAKGLYVCWNPNAQPQYLRIALANGLNRPERANWRAMDSELDKKLTEETITRLKPYFL
ncbi:MAG: hypothetical protein AAB847_00770 [Patescibacteria group bacterium]